MCSDPCVGSNLFRLSSDQVSDLGDEGECASKQLHSLLQIVSLPLGETIELRTCHLKINHVELYIFKHEIVWRELDVWHVSAISNHLLSTLVSPFMRSLLLLLKHPDWIISKHIIHFAPANTCCTIQDKQLNWVLPQKQAGSRDRRDDAPDCTWNEDKITKQLILD